MLLYRISIISGALGTANYNYDFKTDDKGVTHFAVSPETITCQPIGTAEVKLNPELLQALKTSKSFFTTLFFILLVGSLD